jgi:signal transduction histidine kinase
MNTLQEPRFGLSSRLLALTILFVMLAEILIYVPSMSNFRVTWLSDRMASSRIAALALDSAPDPAMPSFELGKKLLEGIGARLVAVETGGQRRVIAESNMPPETGRSSDLTHDRWWVMIHDAFAILLFPSDKPMRVMSSGHEPWMDKVEVVIDEAPLRAAMLKFSGNILLLSVFISLISAGLVYMSLLRMIVRPVRALAGNLVTFTEQPEDRTRIIIPSQRQDEIGIAERALERMEKALANELQQKRRLADLGLAISKVNHELRNMLTGAQLMADHLDNEVSAKRLVPRLVATLARAIAYCEATLSYGRAAEPAPRLKPVRLKALVQELPEYVGLLATSPIRFINAVPEDMIVHADSEQLTRVFVNLMRNSIQALEQGGAPSGESKITVEAFEKPEGAITIHFSDNGPGIPGRAKQNLFKPFEGSVRPGGTGLGLAICSEIIRLHGGNLTIDESSEGAKFVIILPNAYHQNII